MGGAAWKLGSQCRVAKRVAFLWLAVVSVVFSPAFRAWWVDGGFDCWFLEFS